MAIYCVNDFCVLTHMLCQLGNISWVQVRAALPMLSSSLHLSSSCFFRFWASFSSAQKHTQCERERMAVKWKSMSKGSAQKHTQRFNLLQQRPLEHTKLNTSTIKQIQFFATSANDELRILTGHKYFLLAMKRYYLIYSYTLAKANFHFQNKQTNAWKLSHLSSWPEPPSPHILVCVSGLLPQALQEDS